MSTPSTSLAPFGPAPAPPPELLRARRLRLAEEIGFGAAVIPAYPELLKSRDTEVRYRPSSDLFYFTGFTEPEAVAVIGPADEAVPFTLFVRERDPAREVWVGPRAGVEGAAKQTGADAVYPIRELSKRLPELLRSAEVIHYPMGASTTLDGLVQEAIVRARRARPRTGAGPTAIADLEAAVGPLRLRKDDDEIGRLRTAARIAVSGHRAAFSAISPGTGEWEVEAALESTMRRLGAEGPSFPSIVASGSNSTILHYVSNRRVIADGDLVLIDAGAEWGMYCSDITRTVPASGRFSPEQRDLYEVVLAAERAAIEAARPGAPVSAPHDAAVRTLTRGMMELGILPDADLDEAIATGVYRPYYMHQSSHWLGLDVHDVGPYTSDGSPLLLEPGMVMTIEPGMYIPSSAEDVPDAFRGLGVRIEDDLLIVEGGVEVLTGELPTEPDEVQELVGSIEDA